MDCTQPICLSVRMFLVSLYFKTKISTETPELIRMGTAGFNRELIKQKPGQHCQKPTCITWPTPHSPVGPTGLSISDCFSVPKQCQKNSRKHVHVTTIQ